MRYGFSSRKQRRKKIARPSRPSDVVVAALGLRPRGWRAEAWWEAVCFTALNAINDDVEYLEDPHDDPVQDAWDAMDDGVKTPEKIPEGVIYIGPPNRRSQSRFEITQQVYRAVDHTPLESETREGPFNRRLIGPVQAAINSLLLADPSVASNIPRFRVTTVEYGDWSVSVIG